MWPAARVTLHIPRLAKDDVGHDVRHAIPHGAGHVVCGTPAIFFVLVLVLLAVDYAIFQLLNHELDVGCHPAAVILQDARRQSVIIDSPPEGMLLGVQCCSRGINTEEPLEGREHVRAQSIGAYRA